MYKRIYQKYTEVLTLYEHNAMSLSVSWSSILMNFYIKKKTTSEFIQEIE